MNGNVTKDGITADLEAMARVGIGGTQIFDAEQGIPHGPIQYNSPEWRDMVKYAAQEAARLGMELCIHNCGGWSSSGGPWNTPEHGMQIVVTSETQVHGPTLFNEALPQPPTKLNSYQDIAVLAFRTPPGGSVQALAPKVSVSVPGADPGALTDGKDHTAVVFPPPTPDVPQFIQFEFDQPYAARQLELKPGQGCPMYECQGTLEASDDGSAFRMVTAFVMPESSEKQTITFAPVSARFYRVVFKKIYSAMKQLSIAGAELSPKLGIENFSGKTFRNRGGNYKPVGDTGFAPDEVVSRDGLVDLTGRLGTDGKLNWDVPAGDWTILRVGHTPTGRTNHPAPKEGIGLECDKLSREAVEAHWAGMMGPLIEHLGPLAGKTLNNVLIDSYEVGSQNWTPDFRAEFQKRCGYDIIPFLPTLAGHVVDNPEITERFLWDFRRTIADLFAENYSGVFAELAHKNGMLYSVEPYGVCPADDLQYGAYADIPMREFWAESGGGGKLAASISHMHARKFVGAEAFTATPAQGKWLKDPFSLKAVGDLSWCSGINRFILHCYAHQPWTNPTRYPGMTMGQWGTHFGRTTTWWEQSRDWMRYIARSQYLLQQGLFVADVCFFAGDGAPNSLTTGPLPPGHDFDGCSAGDLSLMSVKDGRIILSDGMSYRLLALPPDATMTPATLRKIKELADAGALIVGQKPSGSPSLKDFPACDAEVILLAGETKIITGKSLAEVLTDLAMPPDFEVIGAAPQTSYIHRVIEDTDVYFVSNQSQRRASVDCAFRVRGKKPELWHPDTGRIEDAPVWREENGRTIVPVELDPSGSVFVVFRKPPSVDHLVSVQYTGAGNPGAEQLVILKAEYGVFSTSGKSVDITPRVAAQVKDGCLSVKAGRELADCDPAPMVVKELLVEYLHDGKRKTVRVAENALLELPDGEHVAAPPAFQLTVNDAGRPDFHAWQPGKIEAKTSSGKALKAEISDVPQPLDVPGPWELNFPASWGAPSKISLPQLISWTDHSDTGVKYFSGTATYIKDVDIPGKLFGTGHSLWLDLGQLKNIAEVSVNGKVIGVLWKPPYRADITGSAKPGRNRLEIKVTNLWPNRLIGDEQLPPDCEWNANLSLKEWPQWLLEGKPSPTGRLTFTTWHHWSKDDKPLPSGLLGPVAIRVCREVPVK